MSPRGDVMIVAIMGDMPNIATELWQRGYRVVQYGQYSGHIDAIVYGGEGLVRTNITVENVPGERAGVLMVNADGKDIEDIETILKMGGYTPLGLGG
jgi:hypothetical protein